MNKLISGFFSMKMMALGLFIFLFAIASATFLESIYDIQTAKIIIYDALWFELLLVYLGFNLLLNTFRYAMWKREKIAMLLFHLSFIVILIGAGITRYVSFEGIMKLPEPDPKTGILRPVDYIYSADPRLKLFIDNKYVEETLYLSEQVKTNFNVDFEFPEKNKTVQVELIDFQSKHIDSLIVNDTISNYVIDLVTAGKKSNYLSEGGFMMIGNVPLSFSKENAMPGGVELSKVDGRIMMKSSVPTQYLPMTKMVEVRKSGKPVPDSMYVNVPTDSLVVLNAATLYYVNGQSFVFNGIINHAQVMRVPSGRKDVGKDYVTLKFTDGEQTKIISVAGGKGVIATEERFNFNGMLYSVQYGCVPIPLPFTLACKDFILHKYPGSNSPSSYESIVTLKDNRNDVEKTQKIFMNNVLDYDGYRFFQSSYYEDETGTILSVNHDWWGTNITYIGYLLMSLGMVLSLFAPNGRFKELNNKLKRVAEKRAKISAMILMLFVQSIAFGHNGDTTHTHHEEQQTEHVHQNLKYVATFISQEHADRLAYLMVQDYDGRIVPIHTLSSQLMRKIHRGTTYTENNQAYNAVQTVLSMHMYPNAWLDKKIIYVSSVLREELGLDGKYASYLDLLNEQKDQFKLSEEYLLAHRKLEKERDEFDKKLIKLVERFQVFTEIQMWDYMRLIPISGDDLNKWYPPFVTEVQKNEQALYKLAMNYFQTVSQNSKSGNFTKSNQMLAKLIKQQRQKAGDTAPSKSKINVEVRYNKMNIFKNVQNSYLIFGFLLLVVFVIHLFVDKNGFESKTFKLIRKFFYVLIGLAFIYQAFGLGMHWYITGYAPWSDGYEAVVFISWVTILAGFIFSKKNQVILGATCLLAFFMLFVTQMNILDPEITPLIPVLKSYWLMIHVAIITGSYAFLGLGAILGLINLFLYLFRTTKNQQLLTFNIKELTYVSEMSITIGTFMLTIGTFLGGIWANESWGRYWGWDPKETWALVSILVYAILLHLRFIPALKNKFVFNVVSLWSYSAILFTFFGVNFYLVGLHSYAQGDGLGKFPMGVVVATIIFYIFTELAGLMHRKFKQNADLSPKYFLRKATIMTMIFGAIYVLFGILLVIEWAVVLDVFAKTIGIIFGTHALLLLIQLIFPKKTIVKK